jgi:hypothetical protein
VSNVARCKGGMDIFIKIQKAAIVMKNNNIPINDLYSLCLLNMNLARGDRFHRTAPMYRMIAIQIVSKIDDVVSKNIDK